MGLFRESHSLALEGGNRLYAAIAMENLAALTRLQGEELGGVAQSRFREALLLYRSAGDKQGIASCLGGLAAAAVSSESRFLREPNLCAYERVNSAPSKKICAE